MAVQETLKKALNKFLENGDSSDLQCLIDLHSEIFDAAEGEYPDTHRLLDFCIGTKNYRACRQLSASEKISLTVISESLPEVGVPLWLSGERLKGWAKSEVDNPSNEPTNWETYR
jgi:hypothetical protein